MTFQDNQKKPPIPVPVEPEPGKEPSDKPADEISVTKDPSGKFILQIPAHLWTIILQNKGLEGIKPIPTPKPNPDGSRTVTLTPAQWQTFQDNQKKPPIAIPDKPEPGKEPTDSISVINDPSGNFILRIPGALWIIIQQNRGFDGIEPAPQSKPNDDGSFTVKLSPAQWQIFQDNQKKPPIAVPAEATPLAAGEQPSPGDIAVEQDRSGNYILQIPAALWTTLQTNERFEGIKPTPNPSPNADGSRTVKLSPAQWQTFQNNMNKPSMLVPVDDSVPEKVPSDQPGDNITVEQDPSGKFVLRIPANLWTIIIQNKGFEGIKPTPNPKPNPDGSRTVTLTPAQWKIFQDNRKKPPVPTPAEAPSGDTIAATKDKSGNFVLQIPGGLWTIIQDNKGFEGIKLETPDPTPDEKGTRTVSLTAEQYQKFQDNQKKSAESGGPEGVNITRDPSGNYNLKFHKQHYDTLKKNGGFEGITAKPKEVDGVLVVSLSEVEMKQFNANQEKINQAGDDSISVSLQASGDYMLHIPGALWKMINLSNGFAGIPLPSKLAANADGSYDVKLSPAEWNIFQENQSKATVGAKETPPGENELSVSIDDSGHYVLVLNAVQYNMIQSSFVGINAKPTTDTSGKVIFKLTEAQWQQFQANQAKAAAKQAPAAAAATTAAAPEASGASEVVLNIDTASFESLKGMGAFDGVTYSSSTAGDVVSVRLTQGEFEKFQAKQGSSVSIGKVKIPDFETESERQQREVGKLNIQGLEQSKPPPKDERQVGKLGKVELKAGEEAAKPSVKVGKLSNPFEGKQQAKPAPPPFQKKRSLGRVSSKFLNQDLNNDGGSEVLKSSMTESKRAVRGPSRRAPSSNPVKNLEKRKDVSKDD